jgi:SAM-dependent methyltransferase
MTVITTETVDKCALCGSSLGPEAFGATYTDLWDNADHLRYSYFSCPACHVYVLGNRPVFGPALTDFYVRRAGCSGFDWQHDSQLVRNYTLRRQHRKLEILKRLVSLDAGMRILEVGCANGSFAAVLKQETACEVHANDLDPKFAEHMYPGVIFHGRPFDEDLPPGPNAFDVIISHHVIEHMYNPRAYFDACWKLLKPGGKMILETPNAECASFKQFRADWIHVCAPRHVVLYTDHFFRNEFPKLFPFKSEVHYDGYFSDYSAYVNSTLHRLHLPLARQSWARLSFFGLHLLLNPFGKFIEKLVGCHAVMTVVATKH